MQHKRKDSKMSKMTKDLADEISSLTADSHKMLIVNGRYYCQLEPEDGRVFTSLERDENSPSMFQSARVRILDMMLGEKHHDASEGVLWHQVSNDLSASDMFSLMMHDKSGDAMVNAVSIEIVDEPCSLDKLLSKMRHKPMHEVKDPIASAEGVVFADFGEKDGRNASLEYYINGNVYFEIVDFSGVEEMSIVSLGSPRRTVVVPYVKLTEENASKTAADIDNALDKLFGSRH